MRLQVKRTHTAQLEGGGRASGSPAEEVDEAGKESMTMGHVGVVGSGAILGTGTLTGAGNSGSHEEGIGADRGIERCFHIEQDPHHVSESAKGFLRILAGEVEGIG